MTHADFVSPRLAFLHRASTSAFSALLAGALLPLAFAPFGYKWLAIVCPLVLLACVRGASPRLGLWRGWLFGLGMFGVGVSWVFVSIHDFGHVGAGLSVSLTILLIVYLALFPALLCAFIAWCWERLNRAPTWRMLLLIFPAGWTLLEWIRGWLFTGFPWLLLGTSQIDTPLAAFAAIGGTYSVSLAVVWTSGALYGVLRSGSWFGRGGYSAAALVPWGCAALLSQVAWTQPVGSPLKVSLVQGNVPQDVKWSPAMREPTIELYTALTRAQWDSDLIVWPESAYPDFYNPDDPALRSLQEEARVHDTDLLIGILYQDPDSGRYYNSLLALGKEREFYHKRHLVPFTEYLPLKRVIGGVVDFMQVPMSDFSAGGDHQPPLRVAGSLVAGSICFEDAFGEELIEALPEATLLVNVSNDAWFGRSIAPFQHLQIARMRAIETGRPLVRATNTGISAVIDHRGVPRAVAPQFQVSVLSAWVQPMTGATPYVHVGNTPLVLLLFLLLGVGWGHSAGLRTPKGREAAPYCGSRAP